MLFLWNMVGMMNTVGALMESKRSTPGRYICDKGIGFYITALPIVFVECRRTEFRNAGLTILHGTVDHLVAGQGMHFAGRKPDEYAGMKIVKPRNFIVSTFPEKRG